MEAGGVLCNGTATFEWPDRWEVLRANQQTTRLTENDRESHHYSGTIQTLTFSVRKNVSASLSASSLLPTRSRTR